MRKSILAVLVVLFIASAYYNFYLFNSILGIEKKNTDQEKLYKTYPFLAKRIFIHSFSDIILNFLNLRQDLRDITVPYGQNFSVYFEYLPTGVSISINATEEFHQASLFKLPVVMAYYNQLENMKEKDDPLVTIQQKDLDSEFGDLWRKGVGYKIKLSDAIKLALTESDNTAIKLVVPRITEQNFNEVYSALDIDLQTDKEGAIITTKGYSSILKALYFSSVLEEQDSQYILGLLTKTKFVDKLPAGVPQNIPVAHKIGVFNKNGGDEAYMDCGIVYLPNRPYILCMYSRSDEQTAREKMRAISKKVYDYVSGAQAN